MTRTMKYVVVFAACSTILMTGGVADAGKPGACKAVNLGDNCVIYNNAFCAYQPASIFAKTRNLNGSCAGWAKLMETDFSTIPEIMDANWEHAEMNKAILSGVILQNTVLDEADITSVDFTSADLTGVSLRGATANSFTKFSGAKLNNAILDGADLTGVVFEGVELSGASLKGTILQDADLSGVVLESLDLSGATLKGAKLKGASLKSANLQDADLGAAETDADTGLLDAILCNTIMPDGTVSNLSCGGDVTCDDADGDGHEDAACGGDDCDDGNVDVFPGADELCDDGVDNNCDGQVDEDCGGDITQCLAKGEQCTSDDQCCSGSCMANKGTCK